MKRLSLFLLLSTAAWAGIGQCSTTATSLSSYLSNGCYAGDVNFTNLGVTGSIAGSPPPTAPTIGQIDLGIIFENSTAQTLQFSAPGACGPGTLFCVNQGGYFYSQSCTGLSGNSCGTFYQPSQIVSTTSYAASVNPALGSPPAGEYYAITQLSLSPTLQNTGGYVSGTYFYNPGSGYVSESYEEDSFAEVYELYCVGVSSSSGCATANEGEIVTFLENGSAGTTSLSYAYGPGFVFLGNGNTVSFANPGYTQIFIQDTDFVQWAASGTVDAPFFLNSFGETAETPEPSSFFLLAAGLGGAALLRRTRLR